MTTTTLDNPATVNGLGIEDLRALLRSVTDTTERLHATHTTLHEQVARLQQELADANDQLRRTRQLAALGEMAAGIAHEIRNPLGSIQLYAQMLEDDVADNIENANLCRKISKAVTGLDAIVRDVLMFARDTVVRADSIDAADLFESALSNCQSLLNGRNISIVRRLESSLRVDGDATLLAQALTNLLRNAIEAMHDTTSVQPQLLIETCLTNARCPSGERESRIMLAVEDRGSGISDEARARMFNPFFTTRATGTGLGLAIVHRIADAHNGFINVRNIKPHGARFELLLPVAPQQTSNRASRDIEPLIEINAEKGALMTNASVKAKRVQTLSISTNNDSR